MSNIQQYTLENASGMMVKVIDYGGTITNILVPDASGKMGDVVLGFDTPEEYEQRENPFFGCLTGRYANRISKGRFSIDGKKYQLPVNDGENTLHGGIEGFNRKLWTVEQSANSLTLKYTSKDGEEGFPGTLSCKVVYSLSADNELMLDYTASTDAPTVVNLTNHTYFNLSGATDVDAHVIFIDAGLFVEVDDDYIPTGSLSPVANSFMDFRTPALIGKDLPHVKGGFDHTWVFDRDGGMQQPRAALYDPASGRYMEVFTTQPGMQFYSGNFLDGTLTGKNGSKYQQHAGLCLETQHLPDSPNKPSFPSTVLRPGEVFRQTTIYKFSVK